MLLLMGEAPSADAVTRTSPLSAVIDNVELDLAANITASWDGSSQTVTSLANNDWWRGTSGSVEAVDPTLDGTAGTAGASLLFAGGDQMRQKAVSTFGNSLHKTSQDWTFICTFVPQKSDGGVDLLMGTRYAVGEFGLTIGYDNNGGSPRIYVLYQDNTGATFDTFTLVSAFGDPIALGIASNASTGALTIFENDETPQTGSAARKGADDATNKLGVGSAAFTIDVNTKIKTLAFTSDLIDETEWDGTVLPQLNLRDGVTY